MATRKPHLYAGICNGDPQARVQGAGGYYRRGCLACAGGIDAQVRNCLIKSCEHYRSRLAPQEGGRNDALRTQAR